MLGGGFVAVDGAVFWARRSNISITLREVWKRQYLHRALFSLASREDVPCLKRKRATRPLKPSAPMIN